MMRRKHLDVDEGIYYMLQQKVMHILRTTFLSMTCAQTPSSEPPLFKKEKEKNNIICFDFDIGTICMLRWRKRPASKFEGRTDLSIHTHLRIQRFVRPCVSATGSHILCNNYKGPSFHNEKMCLPPNMPLLLLLYGTNNYIAQIITWHK